MNKKYLIMYFLLAIFAFGSIVTFGSTADAASNASLEKQVKDLKAENKKLKDENSKLKKQITSKDKEIKSLKSTVSTQKGQITSKDKEIKSLKSNIPTTLSTKLTYQNVTKSGTYKNGNTNIPVLIQYKGAQYAPVNLTGEMLKIGIKYDKSKNTTFIGEGTSGIVMSDIIKAYYSNTWIYTTSTVTIAGITYEKGYTMDNVANYAFNLQGKYTTITGKLGPVNPSAVPGETSVKFYGDGKLLKEYKFHSTDLGFNINVPVKGVKKLEIITDGLRNQVGLANPIIK